MRRLNPPLHLILILLFCLSAARAQTCGPSYDACVQNAHPSLDLDLHGPNIRDRVTGAVFAPSGPILPSQPGFDPANPRETSLAIPPGTFLKAPAQTLGDLEWSQPFTIGLHLHALDLDRSHPNTVTLFSKGDLAGHAPHYAFTLNFNGSVANFCFLEQGAGAGSAAVLKACTSTSSGQDVPNTYDYDVLITNDGSGSPSGLKLYVNGLNLNESFYENTPWKFGSVQIALTTPGSGYADSTPFSSTGGGPACHLTGTILATAGIPGIVTYDRDSNFGCTTPPTITLTHPTGAGAAFTTTLTHQSIATPEPLYLAGYQLAGSPHPFSPTGPPLQLEKFFIIHGPPSLALVHGLFTHTLFYLRLTGPPPVAPQRVILTEDGCADPDNLYALAFLINLHRLHYVNLLAVTQTTQDPAASLLFRQMLDSATLTRVPVLAPSSAPAGFSVCKTPAPPATDAPAAAAYRKIFAVAPNASIIMINGGSLRDLADLLQTPPDAASPLSGQQLFNAKVKAVYLQGLGCCFDFRSDNTLLDPAAAQYVLTHNGPTPMIFFGEGPSDSGPGPLYTRPATDPLFRFAQAIHSDVREAFDSLPAAALVSPIFSTTANATNGTVIITGRTGKTTATPSSNHLFYPLSPLMHTIPGSHIYTWFLNSIIDRDPSLPTR